MVTITITIIIMIIIVSERRFAVQPASSGAVAGAPVVTITITSIIIMIIIVSEKGFAVQPGSSGDGGRCTCGHGVDSPGCRSCIATECQPL